MERSIELSVWGESESLDGLFERLKELRTVDQGQYGGGLFYCSPDLASQALAEHLRALPFPVVGCTSAGELCESYRSKSFVLALFRAGKHRFQTLTLERLDSDLERTIHRFRSGLEPDPQRPNRFVLLLVDGLSQREERVVAVVNAAFPSCPVVGGSAGDDQRFERTLLFEHAHAPIAPSALAPSLPGAPASSAPAQSAPASSAPARASSAPSPPGTHAPTSSSPAPSPSLPGTSDPSASVFFSGGAVLAVVDTELDVVPFRWQHFEPVGEEVVITSADPKRRIVHEINGAPAAEELAELLGCTVEDLGPERLAAHPFMVEIGGEWYVRSPQAVLPDGSLSFYCAIEAGLPLTIAQGGDLVQRLGQHVEELEQRFAKVDASLIFDCIQRRLEMERCNLIPGVEAALGPLHPFGFNSYGEQFQGLHVNQTVTGVTLGRYR